MKKCIPALILLLFLTGCFQYSISVTINPDKGADIQHHVYISKSLIDMDNEELKDEIKDDSVTITENEDYTILSRIVHIEPEHFDEYGITIHKGNGGYTAVFDPYKMLDSEERDFSMTFESTFVMDVSLEEGSIIKHNGDSLIENTAYFTIPFTVKDEYELPEIRVNTGSTDITLYIVVFAAIIIMLAGIVIIQLKGKK